MYELQRKQTKFNDNVEFFTEKGIIEYIANHITVHMPEWELKDQPDVLNDSKTDIHQ